MGSVTEPGQAVEDDHSLALKDLVVKEALAVGEDDRAVVGSADHRERGAGRGRIDTQERYEAVDVSLEAWGSVTELGSDLLGE
jgi:hypothetical protein